jgi:hypothetical protein
MYVFRLVLAGLVAIVWLLGYALAWTRQIPETPTELTALMGMVLGWALGGTIWDVFKRRNGNGGDSR